VFAASDVPFLDMAKNQAALAQKISDAAQPSFAALGLELSQFTVENLSLPDELTKVMDQRIGVQMAGNLGSYTQFEAAQALGVAAANPGGTAGAGVGIGAGISLGRALAGSMSASEIMNSGVAPTASAQKFCTACGKPMARAAKFCSECGAAQ